MFAILVVERELLEPGQLPFLILNWLEVVGGVALLALVVLALARVFQRRAADRSARLVRLVGGLSLVLFVVGGALEGAARSGNRRLAESPLLIHSLLAIGGLLAILALTAPLLHNLMQISPRRIWALARLSFKEALRRRVLLAFSVVLIGFLFAGWFLPAKPEHQLATYVEFVFTVMSGFLLLIAVMLASFGIPTDLKTQTMYTIITKPVERFEIVLGRCVGYILLMTVVLVVMAAMSLVYIARGIDPDAKAESYKARVPIFGNFHVPKDGGVSVGREWDYRRYIQGGVTDDVAIWGFPALASNLATRSEPVPCEFSFDIFRTTKGKEGRAIRCSFLFTNQKWDPKNEAAYKQALDAALDNPDPKIEADVLAEAQRDDQRGEKWSAEKLANILHARRRDKVAEQFGIYERLSKEVADYHTFWVAVPAGLFKSAGEAPGVGPDGNPKNAMTIQVRCEDPTQYLGVARHDLYLLNAERSFEMNFFKGAVGLWCRIVLVIVLAVSLSTYLSGIVSAITTGFLYLAGLIVGFIQEVALGRTQGGGPFEAFIRLARGSNLMAPLEQTATIKTAIYFDIVFRNMLRPFLLVIPDVHRYDLKDYVAQGFDVSAGQIFADNLVPLAGYLIPWIVLAFFMMRSREIAS